MSQEGPQRINFVDVAPVHQDVQAEPVQVTNHAEVEVEPQPVSSQAEFGITEAQERELAESFSCTQFSRAIRAAGIGLDKIDAHGNLLQPVYISFDSGTSTAVYRIVQTDLVWGVFLESSNRENDVWHEQWASFHVNLWSYGLRERTETEYNLA